MKMNFQKGFSLIELVLVMSLMGILSVTAMVSIRPSSTEAAARQVMADIRTAQKYSEVFSNNENPDQNHNHGFFTDNARHYQLYAGAPGQYDFSLLTKGNFIVDLSESYDDVEFQGNYRVEFDNWGRPVLGADIPIVLSDGQVTKTILVTAETGHISMQ